MKLFCILIYDGSVERLWTAKKNLCILKQERPSRDWLPVGPVTQSGTGAGASLAITDEL